MFERFTDRARKTMALANQEAQSRGMPEIGAEHLLLGLLAQGPGTGANILKQLGLNLISLKSRIHRTAPKSVAPGPATKLPPGTSAKRVIERSINEARDLGHDYVGTEHMTLALVRETDGDIGRAWRELGVTHEAARQTLLEMFGQRPPSQAPLVSGCDLCATIKGIRVNANVCLLADLSECFALLSDNQGPRGWCVLILKSHEEHLADLDPDRQLRIFRDVSRVASAIRAAFPDSGKDGGPPRINYECLGNLVPHIHWHVIPRHADDPDPTKPVWGWPDAQLKGTMTGAERAALIKKLREHL